MTHILPFYPRSFSTSHQWQRDLPRKEKIYNKSFHQKNYEWKETTSTLQEYRILENKILTSLNHILESDTKNESLLNRKHHFQCWLYILKNRIMLWTRLIFLQVTYFERCHCVMNMKSLENKISKVEKWALSPSN